MSGFNTDEDDGEGGGSNGVDAKSKRRSQHAGRPKFTTENLYKTMGVTAGSDKETQVDAKPAVGAPVFTRDVLSPDQVRVYDAVLAWYKDKNRRQDLKFGGLAGTGKTTLVSVLATELLKRDVSVVFGAFTGKAANVLGRKLKALKIGAGCKTLHSLLYQPIMHDHENTSSSGCNGGSKCPKLGRIERWQLRSEIEAGLIVVDEASMVNKELWEDLLSFGVPVLAVGDHGQLPPVGGKDSVNLMSKPDLVLEQIHRQAAGNPILALAHHVRAGRSLHRFDPSDDRVSFGSQFMAVLEREVAKLYAEVPDAPEGPFGLQPFYNLLLNQAIICGKNDTRTKINSLYRRMLEYQGEAPDPGDIVIALKNFKPVFNGMRGTFEGADYGYDTNEYGAFMGTVLFPDDGLRVRGDLSYPQFGRAKAFEHPRDVPHPPTVAEPASRWDETGLLFDYGYALTCHKAQGSQWGKVIVCAYDTFGSSDDRKRWLYTAVTRASDRLIVVR